MSRYVPNEANCPVELDILGLLLRSSRSRIVEIAAGLGETERARLAAFCFQRSHMREIGLIVAGSCSETALRRSGGLIGEMLVEQRYADAA